MIRYFAAHPTAANLLLIGIFALGLFALPQMRRDTFPEIAPSEVRISIVYPGSSPQEVEDALCTRIEDAVGRVDFLRQIRCEAREGIMVAVAEMHEGHDIDRFTDNVKNEIDAIRTLPALTEPPVVEQVGILDFVANVAITGPKDPVMLRIYAEDLKHRLQGLPMISQVGVNGFSDLQIRIELSMEALRRYGLTVEEVANRVRAQNLRLPAGVLETDDAEYFVLTDDERRTADQLRELVVLGAGAGGEVRLGDMAQITQGFEYEQRRITFDDRRAAILQVLKPRDEDSLRVLAALEDFLAEERTRLPEGMELTITTNLASIVSDRLEMLTRNGLQGLLLVFLTLWLFFSFRYSFWVTLGLPASFLGAIFLMNAIGYAIDMITMVGMLIAIGLLMDDAIVMAENIHAQRQRGKQALDAAVAGVREVAPGILSSFLTTVCIFGALAFMAGDLGQIMRAMPVVLILVLAVSLVEAFLILPHHLSHGRWAHKPDRESRFHRWFDARFHALRSNWFGPLVDLAVRWRYLTVGICLALVLLALALPAAGILQFRAFPQVEGDVVSARIVLPASATSRMEDRVVDQVVAAARRLDERFAQPEGRSLVKHITVEYGEAGQTFGNGGRESSVMLDLLGAEERVNARVPEILAAWREFTGRLPDVTHLRFEEFQPGPAGEDIEIRLQHDDLDVLKQAALELKDWLGGYRGTHDLYDNLQPGRTELRLHLKDGATAQGVSSQSLADQVRAAFQGVAVQEFFQDRIPIEINVRLHEDARFSLGDMDDFVVAPASGQGGLVPLHQVAQLREERGWARIIRVDGRRSVTVTGSVDAQIANAAAIVGDTRETFLPNLQERHSGLTYTLEGQAREAAETGASILRNMILGLVGVYLLLAFQFRSYIEPVAVMAAIPLGLIGAFLGHLLLGFDLSMPSIVGLASLAGVVVNDSILLVMFTKNHLKGGLEIHEAAAQAARDRFRAILLTSLTTVMGLLPLLLETSLQAQVLQPLVTSVAFGLTSATLLSLFLVPCIYAILADLNLIERAVRNPNNRGGRAHAS
ncbi:efflux RND transporter permease subunit [Geoalkalibacter halelectricus]|uniref:efflux RND transporter permease subunit n=1 Tax=Geoalkalibacter halelectricus TaxID=2847045 RepID=UPI003D1CC3B9